MRAAIIAGVVALLVSATSATAAFVVTSKNIKNGTIQTVDLSAKAKQALKGNRGPRGIQGAMGLPGMNGPKGDKGDKGATGDPWTLGGSLPSAKTLRGVYALYAVAPSPVTPADFEEDAISFGFTLAAKPVAHYVFSGDPATAECPGSASSPQAAPGNLCVYESIAADNAGPTGVFNPVDNAANQSATRGFGVHVEPEGPGPYWVQGSWAVTAP
jgi:hypothetical protein